MPRQFDVPALPASGSDKIDTTLPNSARIWNYWLGGKDNYEVDRDMGDQIAATIPGIANLARESRFFLARVVGHLAGEVGIDQFLDIGTGLPTVDNTHEVAQQAVPEARVVYVDNDPLVLSHARALLTSTPEGATAFIDADVRDPGTIVKVAAQTLDLTRPVAVLMLGVLHFVEDTGEAYAIVERLMGAVPAGSHLVIAHSTTTIGGEQAAEAIGLWNRHGTPPMTPRTPEEIGGFFAGLELLEPGVVSCSRWRPPHSPHGIPDEVDQFSGVGRKP